MRIAIRELLRRPGRFLPVGGALTPLVVLLIVLGGFLDGLALDSTGGFRAQGERRLWVLADVAELQLARSLVDPDTAAAVSAVEGVVEVGGLGVVTTTASPETTGELIDVAVFGYERAGARLPPPPGAGAAIVDDRLQVRSDVQVGDTIEVGPGRTPYASPPWPTTSPRAHPHCGWPRRPGGRSPPTPTLEPPCRRARSSRWSSRRPTALTRMCSADASTPPPPRRPSTWMA